MEKMPVVGFVILLLTVILGIGFTTGGSYLPYLSLSALLITVGGSFGAAVVIQRVGNVKNFFLLISKVFSRNEIQSEILIPILLTLSEKSRREGLLSLEEDVDELNDPFLRFSLQLVIDGTDPEVIKGILNQKIESLKLRHQDNRRIFENLGEFSPAFGLFGTVVGLIYMLGSLGGDFTVIGRGMSTALLTTLYGVFLSNGVWIPIANKLAQKTEQEVIQKTIILEGVISIQFGDNPRILRQKLKSYSSDKGNKKIEDISFKSYE